MAVKIQIIIESLIKKGKDNACPDLTGAFKVFEFKEFTLVND